MPLGIDSAYGAPRYVDYDKIPEVVGDVYKDANGSGETSGASRNANPAEDGGVASDETEVQADDNANSGDSTRIISDVDGDNAYFTVEATAYVALCDSGCSGVTFTGIDVRNSIYHEGERIIAVDPAVIPLGSRVEVNVNGESFIAKALDTGGAIKGRKIDVLVATESEAWAFGRQDVEVRVLK